ncbi:MAG: hypothetical protein JWO67_1045 [Streptosporangiaceae bacterium]|nr:hypothetical protein [Streptosporangiaceae bacterium]
MPLLAISVRQPEAWSIARGIALGGQDVMNRSWTSEPRGPIAVHASVKWDTAYARHPGLWGAWRRANRATIPLRPDAPGIHRGAVIAVADLTDICTARNDCNCGPWSAAGLNHWQLDNVQPLSEPIPCRGDFYLWQLPEDVETRVHAALADDPGAGKTPVEVTQ